MRMGLNASEIGPIVLRAALARASDGDSTSALASAEFRCCSLSSGVRTTPDDLFFSFSLPVSVFTAGIAPLHQVEFRKRRVAM
jgi:hypothetical protein